MVYSVFYLYHYLKKYAPELNNLTYGVYSIVYDTGSSETVARLANQHLHFSRCIMILGTDQS